MQTVYITRSVRQSALMEAIAQHVESGHFTITTQIKKALFVIGYEGDSALARVHMSRRIILVDPESKTVSDCPRLFDSSTLNHLDIRDLALGDMLACAT
jgi:hypothetical protein